jgi:hypothetical protein
MTAKLKPSEVTELADLRRRLADLERMVRQIPPRQSGFVEKGVRPVIVMVSTTGLAYCIDPKTHVDLGYVDQAESQVAWRYGATFLAWESDTTGHGWALTKRLTNGYEAALFGQNGYAVAVGDGVTVHIATDYIETSYLAAVWDSGTPFETDDPAEAALFTLHWPGSDNGATTLANVNLTAGQMIGAVAWCEGLGWVPCGAIAGCQDVKYRTDAGVNTAPVHGNVLQYSTDLNAWRPGWGWPTGGSTGQVFTKTGTGWADVAWVTPSVGDGVGVPSGGTTGQVLGKTSGTDYAIGWIDQTGSGGGDVSITLEAGWGIGFADGLTGTETGSEFTLVWVPFDNSGGDVPQGSMLYRSVTETPGNDQYGADVLAFPASIARNAVLVADATTNLPKWVKAIEVGDTTNAGGTLKIWYSAGKYFEISSTGKVRCYESATADFYIDMANRKIKATFDNTNTIELAASDFVGTGKLVKVRELNVCDDSGVAKKCQFLCSALY